MPHSRMMASRNTHTWIQKYIFPGGLLPSTEAITGRSPSVTPRCAPSTCSRCDRTTPRRCGCGGSASSQRRNAVSALGFDDVFHRMWELYLAYSEAGFRSGYLDVYQWTFAAAEVAGESRRGVGWPRWSRWSWCSARHLPDRPAHRSLQRRRRRLGPRLRRGGRGRRGGRHRRPDPPSAAAGPGVDLGPATGLASSNRKTAGKGEDPALREPARRRLLGPPCAAQDLPAAGRRRSGSSRCRCSCRRPADRPRPGCSRCLVLGVAAVAASACFSRPSATTSCRCSRPTRPTRA